jgi:hypothetical protein
MKRREFIGLLAGTAALRPPKVRAQQPAGKVIRIGYLGVASASEGARGASCNLMIPRLLEPDNTRTAAPSLTGRLNNALYSAVQNISNGTNGLPARAS